MPPARVSRSCRNLTPPVPAKASSDSTMPLSTRMEMASILRSRMKVATDHSTGGAEDAISAPTVPSLAAPTS